MSEVRDSAILMTKLQEEILYFVYEQKKRYFPFALGISHLTPKGRTLCVLLTDAFYSFGFHFWNAHFLSGYFFCGII